MLDTERLWNAGSGLVTAVVGALWLAGTLKTDPGLGQGWARDVGNVLAFYWMPAALLLGGAGVVVWNLLHLRKPR